MIVEVPLEMIIKNPWQTRQGVDQEHIKDLAIDIATNGLLQTPLGRLAYPTGSGLNLAEISASNVKYQSTKSLMESGLVVQLAFGHNRLEAYKLNLEERKAGWGRLPVDIRVLSDEQMADYAWSENERRQDLSPIERARAIQARMEHFGWTQEQIADRLQLGRSTVANILRLLSLPEDLQAKLGDGLTERTAIALLSLFSLPEFIRKEADKQIEYPWNDKARETKPSSIIKDALAGEPSDRIRSRIEALIKQFGEKLSGAPWKYGDDFQLLMEGIDLPENLSLGALRSFACSACELRHENHICLDKDCFAIKSEMWRISKLQQASQLVGIPYLNYEEANRFPRSSLNDYHARDFAQKIIASKCENLRLVYSITTSKNDPDVLKDYSNIRVICQKRIGSCACIQGIQAQRRELYIQSPSEIDEKIEEEIEKEQPETSEPAPAIEKQETDAFDPAELEEKARAARRTRRESLERIPAIKEEFAKILAYELRLFNVKLWKDVIGRIHWKTGSDFDKKDMDFEKIVQALGIAIVENKMPNLDYIGNNPDPAAMVRGYLDRYLTEIGHAGESVQEEVEAPA